MNYTLAKELKDAGFPQNIRAGQHFFDNNGVRWRGNVPPKFATCGDTVEPTLEELIEACGEDFKSVEQRQKGEWVAYGRGYTNEHNADTPTEAVARLFVALNKKV